MSLHVILTKGSCKSFLYHSNFSICLEKLARETVLNSLLCSYWMFIFWGPVSRDVLYSFDGDILLILHNPEDVFSYLCI